MLRGLAAVNRRTKAAREIIKWRAELLADLGGEARLTAAQRTRCETLVRTKLLLEHLDAELLEHHTLFARNGRLRQTVKLILTERNRMADSLERGLAALGQAQKGAAAPLPSIEDVLAQQATAAARPAKRKGNQ
jgi:hypothetical protein